MAAEGKSGDGEKRGNREENMKRGVTRQTSGKAARIASHELTAPSQPSSHTQPPAASGESPRQVAEQLAPASPSSAPGWRGFEEEERGEDG